MTAARLTSLSKGVPFLIRKKIASGKAAPPLRHAGLSRACPAGRTAGASVAPASRRGSAADLDEDLSERLEAGRLRRSAPPRQPDRAARLRLGEAPDRDALVLA